MRLLMPFVQVLSRKGDNKMATVTFKPVCECGYMFKSFKFKPQGNRKCDSIYKMLSCFEPCVCPKCGRYIESFIIPISSNGTVNFEDK